MRQYLLGFLTALLIGLGMLYAQGKGYVDIFMEQETKPDVTIEQELVSQEEKEPAPEKRKKKQRVIRTQPSSEQQKGYQEGEGQVGDDLQSGARQVDGAARGGESQLTNAQIEQGIDRVFNGIQRCLMLMSSDAPSTGNIVIGMSVAPSGEVTRVNLTGTNAIITGECGSCIMKIVRSIKYPPFEGPEMIVRYPVTFD